MSKNPALTAVEAAEKGAEGGPPRSNALRTQAAFVRALADEVDRHHPADGRIAAVRGQLGDELGRLTDLVATHASVRPPLPEAERLTVLVAEDDPEALHAVVSAVVAFGHPCEGVGSGEAALLAYEAKPVDIVIADWNMPGMSGLDLCMALKRRDPAPYVVLVTADRDKVDLVSHVEGMPDDFLHKPLDIDDLEARMTSAERLIRSLRSLGKVVASRPIPPPQG